jgi:hypothetical protein
MIVVDKDGDSPDGTPTNGFPTPRTRASHADISGCHRYNEVTSPKTREDLMSATNTIQQLNRDLADKLIEEAQRNPQSPGAVKFVGIVNGKVVVVTDDLDELGRRLRQAEPDPANHFWFEMGRDYSAVHEVWEAC